MHARLFCHSLHTELFSQRSGPRLTPLPRRGCDVDEKNTPLSHTPSFLASCLQLEFCLGCVLSALVSAMFRTIAYDAPHFADSTESSISVKVTGPPLRSVCSTPPRNHFFHQIAGELQNSNVRVVFLTFFFICAQNPFRIPGVEPKNQTFQDTLENHTSLTAPFGKDNALPHRVRSWRFRELTESSRSFDARKQLKDSDRHSFSKI